MARKKSIKKAKEPIRIRFKSLANGNQSIYLDIYHDGKRAYEFLKLYLIPEVGEASRMQNANTLKAANKIKADRIIELANGDAGIVRKGEHDKMLLVDWMEHFKDEKGKTTRGRGYVSNIEKTISHLKEYRGDKVTMGNVDKAYCEGFLAYLSTAKSRKETRAKHKKDEDDITVISKFTQNLYCTIFKSALKMAVRDDVLSSNPMDKTDKGKHIKVGESKRIFLDVDEMRALVETDCPNEMVKKAFIFSCYSGLRISDIRGLKWGDIKALQGHDGNITYKLSIIMQKTQRRLDYTLPMDAMKWLPKREGQSEDEHVFAALPALQWVINQKLKKWAKEAGVKKNISFHSARHTFATLLLTNGADIYTTSKLLGHTRVATTEIYAKIVDKKKDEAMSLLNGVF